MNFIFEFLIFLFHSSHLPFSLRNKGSKKGVFIAMPFKTHFGFPKEPFSEQFLKEPSVKNILII